MRKRVDPERLQDTPKGIVAVYDNGGTSLDRFTIVFDPDRYGPVSRPNIYPLLSCSYNPDDWPWGISLQGEGSLGPHLGKSIAFADLPTRVREYVVRYLRRLDLKL